MTSTISAALNDQLLSISEGSADRLEFYREFASDLLGRYEESEVFRMVCAYFDIQPRTSVGRTIPVEVVEKIVSDWPHLAAVAGNIPSLGMQAERPLAQAALRCTAKSLTIRDIVGLSAVANGEPWR